MKFRDDTTLQQLIEEQVTAGPDRTALWFGNATMTYGELNAKANQLAHALRAEGVGPDQIVGLMVERSFEMMVGILGILKAGGAYLPIAPDNPPDRIRYMLEDAGAKVLLVQNKTANKLTFDGRTINLDAIEAGETANPTPINKPTDLVYVIYTSGSTGRPKGVMIEHRSVVNRLAWMQRAYPIGADDVLLQKTPFYFDVSVWELFWWAIEGAQLCFLPPGAEKIPMALVDTIRKRRITVLHFVPSMLNVFLEYLDGRDPASLASVRRIFASGEALTPSHVKKFNEILGSRTSARLTNLYGPTEATVDVTYYDCPTSGNIDRIPIGKPVDNTRLYILDDELCIAGVQLARGYLNNPALTAEKFPEHNGERIYRTGDIARWLPDGNVEYLGRNDHQVKIRGLRIELGEIENTLRGCPGVADCVVTVKHYSESVILIIAYVVAKSGLNVDEVKHQLRQRLPDYMVPNHFEQIEEIPLSPTGKADRKALAEPAIHARA